MFANSGKLLVPLATMVVAGAVTIGSGATWSSETTKSSTVSAGEVVHTDNGLATLDLADLKPGDVMSGEVTVTNTGSIDSYLVLKETASTNAFSNVPVVGGSYLHLEITASGMTAPLFDGDFGAWTDNSERQVKDGATTDPAVLSKPAAPAAGGDITLTFTVTLDAAAPADDQNATATAAYSILTIPADGETGLSGLWN